MAEMEILSEISRQEREISQEISDFTHKLELKMDLLSRKIHHIEELCNADDPEMVLHEEESSTDNCILLRGKIMMMERKMIRRSLLQNMWMRI